MKFKTVTKRIFAAVLAAATVAAAMPEAALSANAAAAEDAAAYELSEEEGAEEAGGGDVINNDDPDTGTDGGDEDQGTPEEDAGDSPETPAEDAEEAVEAPEAADEAETEDMAGEEELTDAEAEDAAELTDEDEEAAEALGADAAVDPSVVVFEVSKDMDDNGLQIFDGSASQIKDRRGPSYEVLDDDEAAEIIEPVNGVYELDPSLKYVAFIADGDVDTAVEEKNYLQLGTDAAKAVISSSAGTQAYGYIPGPDEDGEPDYGTEDGDPAWAAAIIPGSSDLGRNVTITLASGKKYQQKITVHTPAEQTVVYPEGVELSIADNGREIAPIREDDAATVVPTGYKNAVYSVAVGHTLTVEAEVSGEDGYESLLINGYTVENGDSASPKTYRTGTCKAKSLNFTYTVTADSRLFYITSMTPCTAHVYKANPTYDNDTISTELTPDPDTGAYIIDYDSSASAEKYMNVRIIRLLDEGGATQYGIKSAKSDSKNTTVRLVKNADGSASKFAILELSEIDASSGKTVTITLTDENDYAYSVVIVPRTVISSVKVTPAKTVKSGKDTYYSITQNQASEVSYDLTPVPATADPGSIAVAIESKEGSGYYYVKPGVSGILSGSAGGAGDEAVTLDAEKYAAADVSLSADGRTLTVTTTSDQVTDADRLIVFNDVNGSGEYEQSIDPAPNTDTVCADIRITSDDSALKSVKPVVTLNGTTTVSAQLNTDLPKNFDMDAYQNDDTILQYEYRVTPITKGTEISGKAEISACDYLYADPSKGIFSLPLFRDSEGNAAGLNVFDTCDSFTASKFRIDVTLVRCLRTEENGKLVPDTDSIISRGGTVTISSAVNQAPAYETKFSLSAVNRTVYPGQSDISVASAKFSRTTTFRSLDSSSVEVTPSYKGVTAALDESGTCILASADSDAYPGKYTVTVKAVCPEGAHPVSASISFTVASGIEDVSLTGDVPYIYKPDKKAVSVTIKATAEDSAGKTVKPKKTEWYLVKASDTYTISDSGKIYWKLMDNDDWPEIITTSLRSGKITIKNGKVTIAKDYVVSSNAENNKFRVVAALTAPDGQSVVYAAGGVMEISADSIAIKALRLLDSDGHPIDTSAAVTTDVLYDASLAAYADEECKTPIESGIAYSASGKAVTVDPDTGYITGTGTPGSVKLTAVSTDGAKSRMTITLKTKYLDKELVLLDRDQLPVEGTSITLTPSDFATIFYVGYRTDDGTGEPEYAVLGSDDAAAANIKLTASKGKIASCSAPEGETAYCYQDYTGTDTITLTNQAVKGSAKVYSVKGNVSDSDAAVKLVKNKVTGYPNTSVTVQLKDISNVDAVYMIKPEITAYAKNIKGTDSALKIDSSTFYDSATGTITINITGSAAKGSYPLLIYPLKKGTADVLLKPVLCTVTVADAPKASATLQTKYELAYKVGAQAGVKVSKTSNVRSTPVNLPYMVTFDEDASLSNVNISGRYNEFTRYFSIEQTADGAYLTVNAPEYAEGVADDAAKKLQADNEWLASIKSTDLTGWVNYEYEDLTGNMCTESTKITVTMPRTAVKSVALDQTSILADATVIESADTAAEDREYTLTLEINPEDANVGTVTWTSSDENVAEVEGEIQLDADTGDAVYTAKVTLIKRGSAAITAEVDGKKAVCSVTVASTMDITDPSTWPSAFKATSKGESAIEASEKLVAGVNSGSDVCQDIKLIIANTAKWAGSEAGPNYNGSYECKDASGFVFRIPAGTYYTDVNVDGQDCAINFAEYNNINILMDSGTVIKNMNTGLGTYNIFWFHNCSGCSITGGQIVGESSHSGSSGEAGVGIQFEGCSNMTVTGVDISNFWGDGIRISDNGRKESDFVDFNKNISIINCTVHNNRRNNITITTCSDITIKGCTINKAGKASFGGVSPKFGIDIEPNYGAASNITIDGCSFSGNASEDIGIIKSAKNVTIKNCRGEKSPRNDTGTKISGGNNSWN